MAPASAHPISALRQHATALEAALTVTLARPKPSAVHNIRSATRRIQAQLQLLALLPKVPPHKPQKTRLLKHLARLRRAAGAVRDLDIQQRLLAAAFPHNVQAAALRAKLKQKRDLAAAHLVHLIQQKQAKTAAAIELLLTSLAPWETTKLPPTAVLELTEAWFKRRNSLNPEDEDTLHNIRKAAKLSRYLAESAPGSAAKAAAARFERIQKAGGHWHDWLQLSKLPGINRKAALSEYIRRRIAAHLHAFRATLA
jgi:CHAD domain-containing protein